MERKERYGHVSVKISIREIGDFRIQFILKMNRENRWTIANTRGKVFLSNRWHVIRKQTWEEKKEREIQRKMTPVLNDGGVISPDFPVACSSSEIFKCM